MSSWRCKIGLICPVDNYVIEPELQEAAPAGVSVHGARLHTMELPEMPADAEGEAESLAKMGADAIVYACNASSFRGGPDEHEAICERLRDVAGVPVTTASTAMLRALQSYDVDSVAAITPYGEQDNDRLRTFLEGNGVAVDALSGLGLASDEAADLAVVNEQTAVDTYERVTALDVSQSDAGLIVSTNLASLSTLEAMERDCGVPVVSVNAAMLWHAMTLADVTPNCQGYGSLLAP